ncbi:MAG TPA: hypothetical protein ENI69_05430 [Rhodospirillales bacterium]|nr:hypothetical protein [Rhodospirillales bacterium]
MTTSPNIPDSHRHWHRTGIYELALKTALSRTIHTGSLILRLPDGRVLNFGKGAPMVAASILDWKTLRRITFKPDLAGG